MATITLTLDVPEAAIGMLTRLMLAAERIANSLAQPGDELSRLAQVKTLAQARAAAPKPAGGRSFDPELWTAERLAMMRQDYPAGVPIDALHVALCALPGAPIKRDAIGVKAAKLELQRPARLARAMPAKPDPKPPLWTKERRAILSRDWPAGVPIDTIYAAVTALPGAPVKRDMIAIRAAGLGLRRPVKPVAVQPAVVTPMPTPAPIEQVPPSPAPVAVATPEPAAPPKPTAEPKTPPTPTPRAPTGPPIAMAYMAIAQWAQTYNLYSATHGFDLVKVNAKRAALGLRAVAISKRPEAAS